MTGDAIDPIDHHPRRRVAVLDTEISYVDEGEGDPIVFLHGNPTSSFLWRNIIPHVASMGRCLAPDLVGMGRSGKSPKRAYGFADHTRYLDAWFDALGLTRNVTLVIHDWGSALGFHRAHRFPEQILAIRSDAGEAMILERNLFVEALLPGSIIRTLTAAEMDAYRAPFPDRESRWPTLRWPREIPIEGEPADVTALVAAYGAWLAETGLPELEEPAGGHGSRPAFSPGGLAA